MADLASLASLARSFCLQNAIQHGGTCQPKSLVGRILGAHPRYRADADAVLAALEAAGAQVNALDPAQQRAALEAEAPGLLQAAPQKRRTGLRPLPGDTSRVVLRFAPNPNGPLSLGHSRGLALLAEYRRMYGAHLVLRLDDTDPQVKPPLWDERRGWNGYDMVRADYEWLVGAPPDREVKASDRIDAYYDVARRLLERGGAYVCTCPTEAFRARKAEGTACPCRDQGATAGRLRFDAMVAGEVEPGGAVLRIKTDIRHADPALRDWTAFRVVARDAVHPRAAAGEVPDHRCWPLLDFESAVEDHLQGVTHVIRGKDLMDSTRKQAFLYQHMGWTYPETLYWGRISLHGFGRFSTSWMRLKIAEGVFTGWDDPRLPTLLALRRRGYDPAALRAFWVELGLTEKDIQLSMENLDAADAKAQDDAAPRCFFVPDPALLRLEGAAGRIARPMVHPQHPERGHRELVPGDAVHVPSAEAGVARFRLKDLGNVDRTGDTARFAGAEMDRRLPILQWVPAAQARPFTVLRPGEPGEGAIASLQEVAGVAEEGVLAHVGRVAQFERYGFVRIEDAHRGVWLHG